jgi:predicted O-methyltransferase YrrM
MSLATKTSQDGWARAVGAREGIDLTWAGDDLADGWALPADALALLMALVREMAPRHVLEFGSGLSTRALARASSLLPRPCMISSIDHDPAFSVRAAERVRADGLAHLVRFQAAPLVVRRFRGQGPALPTYLVDVDLLASPDPADLVLIDGPPSMLGGRAGILLQALDHCRPGTTVLLDDANRPEEQEALAHWQAELGPDIDVELLTGYERGLARIVIGDVG